MNDIVKTYTAEWKQHCQNLQSHVEPQNKVDFFAINSC